MKEDDSQISSRPYFELGIWGCETRDLSLLSQQCKSLFGGFKWWCQRISPSSSAKSYFLQIYPSRGLEGSGMVGESTWRTRLQLTAFESLLLMGSRLLTWSPRYSATIHSYTSLPPGMIDGFHRYSVQYWGEYHGFKVPIANNVTDPSLRSNEMLQNRPSIIKLYDKESQRD